MEEEDGPNTFKSLCGDDPFWDANLTWHTDLPEFSFCFRKTALIWGPCAVFWIILPFHLHYQFRAKNAALQYSKLCLVRFCHYWFIKNFNKQANNIEKTLDIYLTSK